MNILRKIFYRDTESTQTTFNEDSIDELGGESENVISNTEETTEKGE